MEETVAHGPTGANEAYLPVRANVTRMSGSRCRHGQEGDYPQAEGEGLDCLVRDVTKSAWWQW